MVKMTIVGRVSDGLPVAQGPRYVSQEHDNTSSYMQQAEFILEEISRSGSLAPSEMIILVDDKHCFHYKVEGGVCFITLCDFSYPRKLASYYLEDLVKEFEKFDKNLINKITNPYSFVRYDGIIRNISRQYIDARTQSNLSKLNGLRKQDLNIISQNLSTIVERRQQFGKLHFPCSQCYYSGEQLEMHMYRPTSGKRSTLLSDMLEKMEKAMAAPRTVSQVWCSPFLEEIASKWTPITAITLVAVVLLWSRLILDDGSGFLIPW